MPDELLLIHELASQGNVAGLLDQLAKGTNVDARDPNTDRTPLMEAISSPKVGVDFLRLLIQRGADVNAVACDRSLANQMEIARGIVRESSSAKDAAAQYLEKMQALVPNGQEGFLSQENVLSIALRAGDLDKIQTLLDAGADIHYQLAHGCNAPTDAMYGLNVERNPQLLPILRLLVSRGANPDATTEYAESALRAATHSGRFDAIRLLLDAGADAAPLQWTPLMRAVAIGSLEDLRAELQNAPDLSARDFWSRTAWLLSLQVGDVAKSKLLLSAGANRMDRGHCGQPPLAYPIVNGHTDMLRWLLSEGFDPDDADDFSSTALMEAAESGAAECAKILIDAGADIHRVKNSQTVVKMATSLEIVRLLVDRGADLNDISDEMRALLTKLPADGKFRNSRADYLAAKHRRFGTANPEKMNLPFWKSMVSSGAIAYAARKHFDDTNTFDGAVWCFKRFGKSINELTDGRIIEIAGEHGDHYDPDFCIYNDVIVHHGDGSFDIYGYPKSCFPPTDFHSATVVGTHIYLIGSLGYQGERQYDETPVFRLNSDLLEMEKLETSGEKPGWISEHKATYTRDGRIRISGGQISIMENGKEKLQENSSEYVLDLSALVWTRTTKG